MSSLSLSSIDPISRPSGHTWFVAVLGVLVLAGGVTPAAAQQRIEVTTRRVGRADVDSVRKLQRQLDSLSHIYNDNEQLSVSQRRKIEEDLSKTIERLDDLSSRDNVGMLAPAAPSGIRMGAADAVRAAQAMSRQLMQVPEVEQAMPRGWLGFVAQGPGLEPRIERGQLIVRYFSYPRVLSVDPSSPAQRAGIAADDTLIAYDGRDVREADISLTRLLRPNALVRVRILRDGRIFEIPVTVAAVPSGINRRRGTEVGDAREAWDIPEGPGFPRIAMAPPAPGGARASRVVVSAQPSIAPTPSIRNGPMILLGMMNAGVAGAQMSTITKDFSEAFGLAVTSGVMVNNAPVGSLAYESGLRDADIITKVGGRAVRTVLDVRQLVELASNDGARSVGVDILRQKKAQRIVLKW